MLQTIKKSGELSIDAKIEAKKKALSKRPPILNTKHLILSGDAREMKTLGSEPNVHLVVTSPPYWTLKEYAGEVGDDQLGHLEDYATFQGELAKVWKRCFDVLVPGGRLCIVVGDVCLSRKKHGRHQVIPLHADISIACRQIGFDYLTPILWNKIANAQTEVEGNGAPFLGKPYEPNAIIKNDIEYILSFRKPGGYRAPTNEQRVLSLIDKEDHGKWFRPIWTDIPGSSRWRGHPAPFPTELAFRLISMFSFVGDTVIDPFLGTGTTTEAAIQAHRSSIGFEIEPSYLQLARERFSQITLGSEVSFQKDAAKHKASAR